MPPTAFRRTSTIGEPSSWLKPDWACTSWSPEAITRAFVRTIGIYPNGSLVRLRSGRLAVVIEQHETDARTPRVRTFFSTRSNLHIAPETVALARGSDEIVGPEDPKRWNVEPAKYLPE